MGNGDRRLVLGSTSRYRRALLERLGMPFDVAAPDVDESPLPGERPAQTALRLSEAKARAVAARFPDALVIGSDQVADCDGSPDRQAGRPRTRRSRSCARCPGARSCSTPGSRSWTRAAAAAAASSSTSPARSARCPTARSSPTSTASSRGIAPDPCKSEGLGIALFERIASDDPTALIGLPLIAVARLLRAEGVDVIATAAAGRALMPGTLYLVPNLLGVVAPADVLPARTIAVARALRHWVVESPKPARAFLKSLELAVPIATLDVQALPAGADAAALAALLAPARAGADMGVLSDAGCPGVADPGAALVAAAHTRRDSRRAARGTVVAAARADGLGHERAELRVPRLPARRAPASGPPRCAAWRTSRARCGARSSSSRRPIATKRC